MSMQLKQDVVPKLDLTKLGGSLPTNGGNGPAEAPLGFHE